MLRLKIKMDRVKTLRLATCLILVIGLMGIGLWSIKPAKAAYNVGFSDMWVGRVTPGSGYIGVDTWWPKSGGGAYNPCQNSADSAYGACILSNSGQNSYYKVQHFTPSGTDFPYGIFIDNQNTNYCTSASWCQNKTATTVNHGWSRLITDAAIEVYPTTSGQYDPAHNNVGGLRVQTDFPDFNNGGRYSKNVGDIFLPQLGEGGVGKLNGFVTYKGGPVPNNLFLLEAFQEQSTRGTSTGYPTTGFSTVRSNSDGYYNLGAVPAGTYKIYITNTQNGHKIILNGVNIRSQYERLDFQLEQGCYGHISPSCTDPA